MGFNLFDQIKYDIRFLLVFGSKPDWVTERNQNCGAFVPWLNT